MILFLLLVSALARSQQWLAECGCPCRAGVRGALVAPPYPVFSQICVYQGDGKGLFIPLTLTDT